MVDIGRDHWESSGPTQPTTARCLLNILKEGDSTTTLGNLCQCSITFNIKMCYLVFRQNWLCSNDPLPFVVALGTTEMSLSLSSLHFLYTDNILVMSPLLLPHLPNLPFSILNSPSSQLFLTGEVLQSLHQLHGPFLESFQLCPTFVFLLELEYQECSTRLK